MKNIPIFFTFNNDYTVPAAVAFYSLLNKARDDVFYEMFVLHSDISKENQELLKNVVSMKKNGKLEFINTNGFLENEWQSGNFEGHQNKNQFTTETILKCFGAKFFPQYDKIIYSDVDIVVMEDISELFDIDLENNYIAAVRGAFNKYSPDELSHFKPEHYELLKDSYFAGGIWVMNLKKIREDNLEQRMIEIVKDDSIIKRWPDQDIINITCNNQVAFVPLNYISYPYLLDLLQKDNFTSHYSREEMFDSIINPKIIHYAGNKPWHNNAKKAEIWWEIFYYLNLPKTSIFKEIEPSRIEKKYKKYKKLFNKLLIFSIVVIAIMFVALITVWIK